MADSPFWLALLWGGLMLGAGALLIPPGLALIAFLLGIGVMAAVIDRQQQIKTRKGG